MKNETNTSRVEVRLTRDKLPVKTIDDLPDILNQDLFQFFRLRKNPLKVNLDKVSKRAKILWLEFQIRVHEVGFNQAKKDFNKSKTFERVLGKHLNISKKVNFEKIAKRKLKKYFGGD
ncbi:hypothetical protein BIY24_05410 [Halobacteriovorax marinus]|uniref:hypothetical protein n=1 Tax=Halobacteriovorax marinus TaxID=97084 RepID=UPI000BC2E2E2|nr:hypothetical protein [Halobacteriovorax marinus]ATH07395.1 hypothetical protein BIY24_05410 [Halobacteriovorax marinus]